MRKGIALDIALETGFAIGDGSPENTLVGTAYFDRWKDDLAVLGRRFSEWLGDRIDEHRPDFVVIEKTIIAGKIVNFKTTQILNGLAWEAHREAEFNDIPRDEYNGTAIKKFITGSGRASKDDVIFAVQSRGFKVNNDHEADAVALLLLHLEQLEGRTTKL